MEFAQFLPSLEVSLQETLAQKDKLYLVEENTKNNIDRRSEEIHKSVEDVRITLHNEVKDIIQGEVTRLEVHEKELNRWIVWLRDKISENDTKNETTLRNQKMTSENSASNPETNDGVLGTLESLTEFEHTLIQFKSETGCNFIDENFGRIDYYTVTSA
ncbi:hypothetical protein FSP39_004028 [Pinctada imbricata]|uniref:Uncharacterized protein n=1 Tax=Pinctada imbricata TaxID=66713 RepID=A0AA89BYP8_PINIB|nr:hypothetical protein FSP39_004028 [Pinctada imbricata]